MDNALIPDRRLFVLSGNDDLKLRIESTWRTDYPRCLVNSIGETSAFLDQCRLSYGCVGVVEIGFFDSRTSGEILKIHQFVLERREVCLLAVVDDRWSRTSRLLQIGFRGVFDQRALSKIGDAAMRYWKTVVWPPQNITELAISNLPWPPID